MSKKTFCCAVIAIWIIGIFAFFLIPNSVLQTTSTTEATVTESTTVETTTEPTTETTTELTTEKNTTKVQVNVRRKAGNLSKAVETTEKSVEKTTTKVDETTKKNVETTKEMTTTTRKEVTTTKKTETTTKKVEPISKNTYTSSDEYLLAQIIFCEAGICDRSEMAKVGKVVLNRVKSNHSDFKNCNTIKEVLYQKGQYHSNTLNQIRNNVKPSATALEVAKGLINGTEKSGLSDNVLWQTGFKPDWNVKVVCETKWHYYSVPV